MRSKAGLKIGGHWVAECYREGRLIWKEEVHNIWTDEGLNKLLNVMFNAATQIATWYCCIVETNTAPAAAMTYAVPTYTESIAYTEVTRPEYVEAASTAKSITNSASKAVFTINATTTIYGASLVGGGTAASTKGDVLGGGTLAVYGLFAAARAVVATDIINLTYSVSAADDAV